MRAHRNILVLFLAAFFVCSVLSCAPIANRSLDRNRSNNNSSGGGSGGSGSGGGGGGGPINLEVPIELVDIGFSSNALLGAYAMESTKTSLTTTDYDGIVTYAFEASVTNTNGANSSIELVDDLGATKATINIPANTNNITRIEAAFTPNVGADRYRVKIPAVNNVAVYGARMKVKQVGATKTKIYIPLTAGQYNTVTMASQIGWAFNGVLDSTPGAAFTQTTPKYYAIWKKDTSLLSTLAAGTPWTLEANIGVDGSAGNTVRAELALYNTNGTAVTGALLTSDIDTEYSHKTTSFADNAANFTNLDTFELRMRSDNGASPVKLYKAGLWVTLSTIIKGEVFYRVGRQRTVNGAATVDSEHQLAQVNTSYFSNPAAYHEVTMSNQPGANDTTLRSIGTNESGTAGANIVGSNLSVGPATGVRVRNRSAGITITDGDRFIVEQTAALGETNELTHSCVVISFQ